LCDLCDLPVPDNLDSRSLVPLLEDEESAEWPNETVSTIGHPASVMIKQDHLKYLYYESGAPEILFDLERDPGETRSVLDDPRYAEDLARFRKRLGELGFGPDADAGYINAGYQPNVAGGAEPAGG
jgi:choline-sulfatase